MGRGGGGAGRSRSGGGRSRGGAASLPSVPANASSFAVGDVVRYPSTSRSSGFEGTVTKVGRSRITVEAGYFNSTVSLNKPAAEFSGGLRARGNKVVRFG
jgi:hypothetical protein